MSTVPFFLRNNRTLQCDGQRKEEQKMKTKELVLRCTYIHSMSQSIGHIKCIAASTHDVELHKWYLNRHVRCISVHCIFSLLLVSHNFKCLNQRNEMNERGIDKDTCNTGVHRESQINKWELITSDAYRSFQIHRSDNRMAIDSGIVASSSLLQGKSC